MDLTPRRKILVLGKVDSGKTTLINCLTKRSCENTYWHSTIVKKWSYRFRIQISSNRVRKSSDHMLLNRALRSNFRKSIHFANEADSSIPKIPRSYTMPANNPNIKKRESKKASNYEIMLDVYECNEADPLQRAVHYLDSDIIILCFDINSKGSIQEAQNLWSDELPLYRSAEVPLIIVATKKDNHVDFENANHNRVNEKEGFELAQKMNAVAYIECSAIVGTGLNQLNNQLKNLICLTDLQSIKLVA